MSDKLAIITRPYEDSLKTAKKLSDIGITGFIEPMLTITFNKKIDKLLADSLKNKPQGLIITSANAVKSINNSSIARDFPIISIGESTTKIAMELGYTNITTASGNAKDLEKLIVNNHDKKAGNFIYTSGDIISRDIKTNLRKFGFQIDRIIAYYSIPSEDFSDDFKKLISSKQFYMVVFYSLKTTHVFLNLIRKNKFEKYLRDITAFCLSKNIAGGVEEIKFKDVIYTANAKSDSLLELIEEFKLTGTVDSW